MLGICRRSLNALFRSSAPWYVPSGLSRVREPPTILRVERIQGVQMHFRHERRRCHGVSTCGPDQDREVDLVWFREREVGPRLSKARTVPRSTKRAARVLSSFWRALLHRCPTRCSWRSGSSFHSESFRAISKSDLARFYVIRTFLLLCALVTQMPSPQVWM
jgi:hypothetical protein